MDKELFLKQAIIVTYEDECKLEEEGLKIEVVPVWKWVLPSEHIANK